MSSGNFQEKLRQLRREYTDLLPLRLKEIDLAWIAICEQPLEESHKRRLRAYVHTLAGSGATFGFAALSARASKLEAAVDDLINNPAQFSRMEEDVAAGIRLLHKAAGEGDAAAMDLDPGIESPAVKSSVKDITLGQMIFWLGEDATYGRALSVQLARFNYRIQVFTREDDFQAAFAETRPDVVVLDTGEENRRFPGHLDILSGLAKQRIPSVCVCPRGKDLSDWLTEVRHGATTCINRPVSLFQLLEKLDPLTFHWKEAPARLFIIDDDVTLAGSIAGILTKAGMEVKVENNPMQVPAALEAFHPDLILIDLYMPDCSGLELARLIRQDARYLTVPIVYLSAETEVNMRLEALEAGADDFILKPVKLRFLYHALSSRIKRARRLRNLQERDVLTGLYNHTTFQEELRAHLWQAVQHNTPLVVALIDIDRFQAINDHHGHAMGDRVLKTLAIKLKRRFADQAVLSRFDGAGFALAFPGGDIEALQKAIDEVRMDFGHVNHEGRASVFEAGFSCGLAHYPAFGNASDLLEGCRKALARAKSLGRNRVVPLLDSGVFSLSEDTGPVPLDPAGQTTDGLVFLEDEEALLLDEETDLPLDVSQPPADAETPAPAAEASHGEPSGAFDQMWGGGRKLVVVDDDRQLLQVLTSYLTNQGFEVYGAATGDEGYDLVVEQKPVLVLIDLLLFPGIHGFELCKKIKTDARLKGTRIILMTAVYKDYRYQVEGKDAGGDAFLIKPINFDELTAQMRPLLS